jgi:hypothetical protein
MKVCRSSQTFRSNIMSTSCYSEISKDLQWTTSEVAEAMDKKNVQRPASFRAKECAKNHRVSSSRIPDCAPGTIMEKEQTPETSATPSTFTLHDGPRAENVNSFN